MKLGHDAVIQPRKRHADLSTGTHAPVPLETICGRNVEIAFSRQVLCLCRAPNFLVPRAASPQTSEEAVDSPSASDESDAYTPAYAIHVSALLPMPQFLLPMLQYDESEEFEDVDSRFLPPFRYDHMHGVCPHHMPIL